MFSTGTGLDLIAFSISLKVGFLKKTPPLISNKGKKWARVARRSERSRNITVHCAMSACGLFVSPMLIFLCLQMTLSLSHGGHPGSMRVCSKSGWMNKGRFVICPKHFIWNFLSFMKNATLLSMDNLSSHPSLVANTEKHMASLWLPLWWNQLWKWIQLVPAMEESVPVM